MVTIISPTVFIPIPIDDTQATTIPTNVDLTSGNAQIDLTQLILQGAIFGVRSIFVDNSLNANNLNITMSYSNQNIVVQSKSQGYYPVYGGNYPIFTFSTTPGIIIPVQISNIKIFGRPYNTG